MLLICSVTSQRVQSYNSGVILPILLNYLRRELQQVTHVSELETARITEETARSSQLHKQQIERLELETKDIERKTAVAREEAEREMAAQARARRERAAA